LVTSLEGSQVRHARSPEDEDAMIAHALELARSVELLLEELPASSSVMGARAHSTRMSRAMAASLVDELEALLRGRPRTGLG
jgi:hypothetical protein